VSQARPRQAAWDANDKALAVSDDDQARYARRSWSPIRQQQTPSTAEAAPWEDTAKTWKARRKSIGANLAQSPVRAAKAASELAYANRQKSARQQSDAMHPLHLDTSDNTLSQHHEHHDDASRAKSPTPSVLE